LRDKKVVKFLVLTTAYAALAVAQRAPSTPRHIPPPDATGENWNSLAVDRSHLKPAPPTVLEMEQADDFTRELVRVEWRPNDNIYLYVIRPKNVPKPPAVLYLYSYPSDLDRFRNDALCRLMTKNGFAAVGFVSALTGHRYHDRPLREWFISELQESLAASVHDVQMIIDYIADRGDMDSSRVGMFGEGSGGTIAILASAVDERLKAIDLFAPWGDWPDWLRTSPVVPEDERAAYSKPEFLKKVESVDPVRWLPRVKASAIRIQYANDQWGTPKIAQDRLRSVAPGRSKIVVHADMKSAFQASNSLFDWIKEELTPAPDRASPSTAGSAGI
jgi:hypothetical protein